MSSPPTPPSPRDPGLQRQKRIRLERTVSLKFKNLEGFVTELSENISMGGMFLRTPDAPPPGTLFDFELTLEEEGPLIQGIAEVVWVREEEEGPGRPAGIGVRFLELAPGSRALIYQMVDEHIVGGGEPFELDGGAPAPPPDPDPTASGTSPVRAGSYAVLASPQGKKTDEMPRSRTSGGRGGRPARRSGGPVLWTVVVLLAALGVTSVLLMLSEAEPEPAASTAPPEARAEVDETETPSPPHRDRLDAVVPDRTEAEEDAAIGSEETNAPEAPVDPEEGTSTSGPSREPDSVQESPPATEDLATERPTRPAVAAATTLEEITWRRQGGALVVTLRTDGRLDGEGWDRFRMDEGTPREVVRIRGIRERFRPSLPVDEPELVRIRTGLHRTARGDELHVVLDLASPGVRLTGAETDGRRLHLTLASQ